MVLLPCGKCCDPPCECEGCIRLTIGGMNTGEDVPAYCALQSSSDVTDVTDPVTAPGTSEEIVLRCVRRFPVWYEAGSQEVIVADAYLSIHDGKAALWVHGFGLGFVALYEKDTDTCPPASDDESPETIVFTSEDMVYSEGDTEVCGSLTYTFAKCPPPPPPPCQPCPRQDLCHDLHENFPETLAVGADTCQYYSANALADDGVTPDGGEYYIGGPTFGIGIFAPGGSPFLNGAFAKVEDRYVDLGGGNWELQRTTIPQTVDDCNNDGTDCNWADYEKALEYWDQGYDVLVWGDLGVTTDSSGSGQGPNGSNSFMNAYHYKFRAYVSCDGGWVDKTSELLKRTELKYYYLVVGGAQSVEIPVTYRSPLQPGIVCLENPLP